MIYRHFTQEVIQMVSKHIKMFNIISQLKITMRAKCDGAWYEGGRVGDNG
jgi:hypothetical protein